MRIECGRGGGEVAAVERESALGESDAARRGRGGSGVLRRCAGRGTALGLVLGCLALCGGGAARAQGGPDARVLRADGFAVRVSGIAGAREAGEESGEPALLQLVNHTLDAVEVELEHARLRLPSGDRGAVSCPPGPGWRTEIVTGGGGVRFDLAVACGSRVEVVEEDTHWRR
jgi:hypothetical protein